MSETDNTPPPAKRELAVALKYDGENAPRVTAKGSGQIADRIVELAREHNIPLQENTLMAQTLSQLELNEEIPPALYLAVAEIIAFAYYLSGKMPGGSRGPGTDR